MQMKDLLQTLLDDGLVNNEKCGVSMVYWCFKHDNLKKLSKVSEMKRFKINELESKKKLSEQQLKEAESSRKSVKNSLSLLKEVNQLTKTKDLLSNQLESKGFDIYEIKKQIKEKIQLGENYADNIEILMNHFQQTGVSRDYFHTELGIPEEFIDYPNLDLIFP